MPHTLETARILVPESRRLDLFVHMLEAEGAIATRCPLVQICDLDDRAAADAWIDAAIAQPFDDLILLTGEGLRRLLTLCGDRKTAFVGALAKMRTVIRGPKPTQALREIGLHAGLIAEEPTSEGVLAALAAEDIAGRRMGIQLYPGEGALPLTSSLHARGAEIFAVTPYRYASESESTDVADVIRTMAAGGFDVVAFTSSPQVERLAAVAREFKLEKDLAEGLMRTRVASIGPVVTRVLKAHGVAAVIQPEDSFFLKPLVKKIAAAWGAKP